MFSLDNLIAKKKKELEFLDQDSLEYFEVNGVLNQLKIQKDKIIKNFEKVELEKSLGYSGLSLGPVKKDNICYLYHFSKYGKQKNGIERHPNFVYKLYFLDQFDDAIKAFQKNQEKNNKNENDDWSFLNEKEKE